MLRDAFKKRRVIVVVGWVSSGRVKCVPGGVMSIIILSISMKFLNIISRLMRLNSVFCILIPPLLELDQDGYWGDGNGTVRGQPAREPADRERRHLPRRSAASL